MKKFLFLSGGGEVLQETLLEVELYFLLVVEVKLFKFLLWL